MDQESQMVKLNCRGEIITLPLSIAERIPVIKASKNFDFNNEYFINHKASDIHDYLDSLEISLKHELGDFSEDKKNSPVTCDDIFIIGSGANYYYYLVFIRNERFIVEIKNESFIVEIKNTIFSYYSYELTCLDKNGPITEKIINNCPIVLLRLSTISKSDTSSIITKKILEIINNL